MKHKLSLLFYLKSSKSAKNGMAPIYLRITINGIRIELSTSRFIEPGKWNSHSGKVKGTSEETRTLNSYLETMKSSVYETERALINCKVDIDAQSFKNKLLGIDERQRMLIEVFEVHNSNLKALIGKDFAENTYKRYLTSLSHTKDFLKYKFNLNDIPISKIDLAFVNDYDFYLRTVKNCNNNSTIKYIRNFGKIVKQCYANGWIDRDPFLSYKGKVKQTERVYLNEEEIQTIVDKSFATARLSLVRDIFIFSCFTGLAYVDAKNLTSLNLVIGIDGAKWIYKNRQKTDTASRIPLLSTPENILEKYKDHPQVKNTNVLLPMLSNQKMNAYLKEIADICGINKELTFHIARHTFATTVTLTNGVPIETVSSMLGHSDLRSTQHYAKIVNKKISDDMIALRQKLTNNVQAKSS